MKVKLVLLSILFSGTLIAGDWEKRKTGYFDELRVSGNLRVQLIPSDSSYIEIFDYCCSMSNIKIDQKGNLLKINNDKGLISDSDYDVLVYYKVLREVRVQVGAKLETTEELNSDNLKLLLSSGANARIETNAKFLKAEVTSGASASISGHVENADVTVNTGANLDMYDCEIEMANADSHTGANLNINVIKSLNADAGTGGNISYRGNPEILNKDVSLGGRICKRPL